MKWLRALWARIWRKPVALPVVAAEPKPAVSVTVTFGSDGVALTSKPRMLTQNFEAKMHMHELAAWCDAQNGRGVMWAALYPHPDRSEK